MDRYLVDSSFLIAYYSVDDKEHYRAKNFIKSYPAIQLIPEVTLTEVTFMIDRAGGSRAAAAFLRSIAASHVTLQNLTEADLTRAADITLRYSTAHLDFVDCAIMALSERLNITQVCTFDRRDFSIFRPIHCEYLELLP